MSGLPVRRWGCRDTVFSGAGLHVGGGVGVGFNPAGHHYLAAGVDHGGPFLGQHAGEGDRHYLFALNANVPDAGPGGSNNLSAFYYFVYHRSGLLICWFGPDRLGALSVGACLQLVRRRRTRLYTKIHV